MKILIVEDERDQMKLVEQCLTSLGFKDIIKSSSGPEAIRLAEEHRPLLCIADIMMPEMTGGEMRKILSENPITKEIPVIFISGIISKAEVKALGGCLPSGDLIIAKPFTRKEIYQAIRRAL